VHKHNGEGGAPASIFASNAAPFYGQLALLHPLGATHQPLWPQTRSGGSTTPAGHSAEEKGAPIC